jgi:2-C-methyl-D-erythritol 4-phosphate cytidylyltransferase
MVACSRENIKITEPADVAFAEAILAMRKKKAEEAAAPAEEAK